MHGIPRGFSGASGVSDLGDALCSVRRGQTSPHATATSNPLLRVLTASGGSRACAFHGGCRAAGGGRYGGTDEPDEGEPKNPSSPPHRFFLVPSAAVFSYSLRCGVLLFPPLRCFLIPPAVSFFSRT